MTSVKHTTGILIIVKEVKIIPQNYSRQKQETAKASQGPQEQQAMSSAVVSTYR